MATIDLGKIKLVWRGTYAGGTAYTVDDVVQHTDSGLTSSFICTTASTGNAPSTSGTVHGSWAYLAKGAAGSALTTSGDILYRGASADARLAKGTANQTLQMDGSANFPTWTTVAPATADWVKVSTTTFDGSTTSYNEDNFSATYDNYRVYMTGIQLTGTTGYSMKWRVRTSAGDYTSGNYFLSGGGWYKSSGSTGAHDAGQWAVNQPDLNGWSIPSTGTHSSEATFDMVWDYFNVNGTSDFKNVMFRYFGWEHGGSYTTFSQGGCTINQTAALTGFNFTNSGNAAFGNMGKIITYGLKT